MAAAAATTTGLTMNDLVVDKCYHRFGKDDDIYGKFKRLEFRGSGNGREPVAIFVKNGTEHVVHDWITGTRGTKFTEMPCPSTGGRRNRKTRRTTRRRQTRRRR